MTDPTQPLGTELLDQRSGRLAALKQQLATNRALQVLVVLVVLLIAVIPVYLLSTADEVAQLEDEPEPAETARPGEPADEAAADDEVVGGGDPVVGSAAAPAPASSDAPAQPHDDPSSPVGCPQPGVPGQAFDATAWQTSDEMYIHVHPEQWYISAWCATEDVARSLGADGWRVSNVSDTGAVAHLVKSGLADDSVFAVEYEVQVIRDARGWYLGSEQARERFWCARGVDVDDPAQCV